MTITELWQQVALAIAGGCAAELLHWYTLARQGKSVRAYAKKPLYWATTIGMVLLGGLMPVLYNSGSANAALCFHLGASAPLLLAKLVGVIPEGVQPQGASGDASFRSFMVW